MSKIEVISKESNCEVIHASVADDASGIHLRLRDETGNIIVRFICDYGMRPEISS